MPSKKSIAIRTVVSWALTLVFYAGALAGLFGAGAFAVACFILRYPWLGVLASLGFMILAVGFWRLVQGHWHVGGFLL